MRIKCLIMINYVSENRVAHSWRAYSFVIKEKARFHIHSFQRNLMKGHHVLKKKINAKALDIRCVTATGQNNLFQGHRLQT